MDAIKEKFEASGALYKPLESTRDLLEVMKLVEATRTAKSHALNDRSSRSHCVVMVKRTIKDGGK